MPPVLDPTDRFLAPLVHPLAGCATGMAVVPRSIAKRREMFWAMCSVTFTARIQSTKPADVIPHLGAALPGDTLLAAHHGLGSVALGDAVAGVTRAWMIRSL